MLLIIGGHCDSHIKSIRKSHLCKQFLCLSCILAVFVSQFGHIILFKGRKHTAADDSFFTVSYHVQHILAVYCITECLTNLYIVKRLLCIVQIQSLHQIHAALIDGKVLFIKLARLGGIQSCKHVNRAAF